MPLVSLRKHVEVSQLRNVLKICYLTAREKPCGIGEMYIIFGGIKRVQKVPQAHFGISVLSTLKIILIK